MIKVWALLKRIVSGHGMGLGFARDLGQSRRRGPSPWPGLSRGDWLAATVAWDH